MFIGQQTMKSNSGDRDRTCDTRLMSPMLYRLSYAALIGSTRWLISL